MRTITPADAVTIPTEAKRVFQGTIFDVYQWEQALFDGTTVTFEMLKRPDTVEIIAVKDGKIVLLKEEQPRRKPYFGMPGGRHDEETETEHEAAKRELREETGFVCATWRLLAVVQPQRKIDWLIYTFLATDVVSEESPQLDAGEKIDVSLLSFDEAKQCLASPQARRMPDVLTEIDSFEALLALRPYDATSGE